MKTLTKRIISVMLSLCLVVAGLNTVDVSAAAKKAPKKITLNASSATVYVNGTYTLYVKSVSPSNAEKAVKWTTSDKKIATITSKGVVKGIKAGKVTITATSTKSKKVVAKCKITVVNPSIKLSKSSINLQSVGTNNKYTLKATVKGPSKAVKWTTSNKKVAVVDKNGVVTAKGKGTATITATANGKKVTCKVKVTVPAIAISASSATIYTAGTGNTITLKAYNNGIAKTATWTTSNKAIATVSSKGVVTGKKAGTATITAKIGKLKITCKVTVKTQSLTLSKSSISIYKGQTYTLKPYISGASKTVTWSSKDSKIAAVDKSGKVTGKTAGTTYIYAKANGLVKSCKVTVVAPTLSLNMATKSVYPGQSFTIKATVKGVTQAVTWTSSDTKVATVKAGVVTAVKPGTAVITATANGVSQSCKVTVVAPTLSIDVASKSVYPTQSFTIKATVAGASQGVTWKSNNTSVAVVSTTGVVTAKKVGKATITATANGVSKSCTVIVIKPTVSLDKTTLDLYVDGTYTLKATVAGASKAVTWKSDNTSVAVVSTTGVVTAKGVGTAIITASANGVEATCTVKVQDTLTTLTFSKSAIAYEIKHEACDEFREVQATVTSSDLNKYKDLYFDRVINFMNKNKEDIFTAWKNAADYDVTIRGQRFTATKITDTMKEFTVSNSNRTETVRVEIEQTTKNVFNVTVTRGAKKVVFSGVEFSVDGNNYKVKVTRGGVSYTLTAAADGKSAILTVGAKQSVVATYQETDADYIFAYDVDLLNELSQNISEGFGLAKNYKLGTILSETSFEPITK